MEEINVLTDAFEWRKAMFVFRATYDYRGQYHAFTNHCNPSYVSLHYTYINYTIIIIIDTGESFGIIPNKDNVDDGEETFDLIILGDEGAAAELSDDEDSELEIQCTRQQHTEKGDAAAWLAKMEGTKTMAKKISGEHEKKKFWDEYKKFQAIGEHGIRDWSLMAEAWNIFVATREEANENEVIKYYRKHAHMLESFFESGGKSNNIKATLQPHQINLECLSKELRSAVSAPGTALSALGPPATHGPNSILSLNTDFSQMVPYVPMHMRNASILTSQKSGPLVYPGQLQQASVQTSKKRILERAIQQCPLCGHYRQHNILYIDRHAGKCSVPKECYSSDRSLKGWCPCTECTAGAEGVGFTKPFVVDIGCKRALKTCKTCGHYRQVGYYSERHSLTECRVAQENHNEIKYVGHCDCEHCVATDLIQGTKKNTKLRRIYNVN
jgi:hypothetical protein